MVIKIDVVDEDAVVTYVAAVEAIIIDDVTYGVVISYNVEELIFFFRIFNSRC